MGDKPKTSKNVTLPTTGENRGGGGPWTEFRVTVVIDGEKLDPGFH